MKSKIQFRLGEAYEVQNNRMGKKFLIFLEKFVQHQDAAQMFLKAIKAEPKNVRYFDALGCSLMEMVD